MAASIPCPMCGSEAATDASSCTICGYSFARSSPSNLGGLKCARCGSHVERGFDFCPICGLNQRERFGRPDTKVIAVDGDAPAQPGPDRTVPSAGPPVAPGGELRMPAVSLAASAGPGWAPSPAGSADRTMMAPPGPPVPAPFAPSIDGTVPAPAMAPAMAAIPADRTVMAPPGPPRSPTAVPAPIDATVMAPPGPPRPPAGMPAPIDATVMAPPGPPSPPPGFLPAALTPVGPMVPAPRPVGDDDRTIPAPGRVRPSEDATTVPHAVAPSPGESDPTVHYARALPRPGVPVEVPRPADDTHLGSSAHGPAPAPPVVAERGREASRTPTHPGTAHARLVLVGRDGSEGERFAVVGDRLTLGRRDADVLFADDEFLSPTHARIERSGETFWLVDLGAQNGVFLRIRQNASIYPGDCFMIGHQLLRVENVEGQIEESPPDEQGTRLFGTPLQPAWGKVVLLGRGGVRGDQFGLRGARVVFGRESGDVLFPNDPFVSREHARLRLELNGSTMSVFIEDLNSANGTYIRIRGGVELQHRDTFRIGDQIIRLRLD